MWNLNVLLWHADINKAVAIRPWVKLDFHVYVFLIVKLSAQGIVSRPKVKKIKDFSIQILS